jgi:hypothetical protein
MPALFALIQMLNSTIGQVPASWEEYTEIPSALLLKNLLYAVGNVKW